jgi:hypothetical protein
MNIYGAWVDFDQPRRFIGEATSPTNIRGLYSSVHGLTDEYKGDKTDGVTDKYSLIWKLVILHVWTGRHHPPHKPAATASPAIVCVYVLVA